MRYAVYFLSIVFFSGCVSNKVAPLVEYRLDLNDNALNSRVKSCQTKTLRVEKTLSPDFLMSKKMYYVQGGTKQYSYSLSQWSIEPSNMIALEYMNYLKANQLFANVLSSKSRGDSDFLLEISLEDFMQYFDKDAKKSHINVKISVTLLSKNGKIIASKMFSDKRDVTSLDAAGGVQALSKSMSEILDKSGLWFSEVCQ